MSQSESRPREDKEEFCWCGGLIVIVDGEKRCSNADQNEVGP